MNYTVAEVAKKLNISPHTIRYYDDQGLLPFLKRDEHGRRIFSDYDVEMLEAVCRGTKLANLQIKEMRQLIDAVVLRENLSEGKDILAQYRDRILESIAHLQDSVDFLESVIAKYNELIEQQTEVSKTNNP